jgi:hypothetical protein
MAKLPDVDIDLCSSFNPKNYFPEIVLASRIEKHELKKHQVGVYFQNIAIDPITKFAAIPYDKAAEMNYFKIDMLHLTILDYFENKQQIKVLIRKAPNWEMLEDPNIVQKLFQIAKHYDIINEVKPTSILELADCVALIRPGKRYLLKKYNTDKYNIRTILYNKTHASDYKKSHAIAYSTIIVLQMHLIAANIIK